MLSKRSKFQILYNGCKGTKDIFRSEKKERENEHTWSVTDTKFETIKCEIEEMGKKLKTIDKRIHKE